MPATTRNDPPAHPADADDDLQKRLRDLSPQQKRALAEKVYALLLKDLRIERERSAVRHRLR